MKTGDTIFYVVSKWRSFSSSYPDYVVKYGAVISASDQYVAILTPIKGRVRIFSRETVFLSREEAEGLANNRQESDERY